MYALVFALVGYVAYLIRATWKRTRRCPHCWKKGCRLHMVGRLRDHGW